MPFPQSKGSKSLFRNKWFSPPDFHTSRQTLFLTRKFGPLSANLPHSFIFPRCGGVWGTPAVLPPRWPYILPKCIFYRLKNILSRFIAMQFIALHFVVMCIIILHILLKCNRFLHTAIRHEPRHKNRSCFPWNNG